MTIKVRYRSKSTNHIKEDIALYSTKKLSVSDSFTCPLCSTVCKNTLATHFKNNHSKAELDNAILTDKTKGIPDSNLGQKYGITFRYLERLITQKQGINISRLNISKKIKTLTPENFKEEQTTVWSFKSRGNWATHSGEYRGNWAPYIPRNIILKYSKPGETVLDYFCGAGTTAVEAKLLGRKCVAMDINKEAISLAKQNVNFGLSEEQLSFYGEKSIKQYEPELRVGDAHDLSFLGNNSVDLICTHPPYADIIHYTNQVNGDFSFLGIEEFLKEMATVAKESYRTLKPGRQCAILIGDTRKKKNVIPLGFQFIGVFLDAGFKLKELIIKRQHNCKTSGFWYANSIKYNFLLLAHEYLPVFEKPKTINSFSVREQSTAYETLVPTIEKLAQKHRLNEMETTTVWLLPENEFEERLNKNVLNRYSVKKQYRIINLIADSKPKPILSGNNNYDLLFIKSPCLTNNNLTSGEVSIYLDKLNEIIINESIKMAYNGFCVIQTKDIRVNDYVEPMAKRIMNMFNQTDMLLKEIIILINRVKDSPYEEYLMITHQYLLVYAKKEK